MIRTLVSTALVVLSLSSTAGAAPTIVTVRAVSRDAKVIGDGVGGARITIRDADTGKVLASGLQTGGTGDTKRIMQEPRTRGAVVYGTEGAAAFRATLDLVHPTRVEIIAEGPLKYPQAMQRASRTLLLLPGQHVEGEGVLLEIGGFIVNVPAALSVDAGQPLTLRAKVTMTCGCPTEPGELWNADHIRVTARVLRGGAVAQEITLPFAGQPSTYEAELPPLAAGTYRVEIIASDPQAANVGRMTSDLTVRPAAEHLSGELDRAP